MGLNIPYLNNINEAASLEEVSNALDGFKNNPIAYAPWAALNDYLPEVYFSIAYSTNYIFLKYYVNEHNLKAEYSKFNDPVFEDSCVEFFISFNGDEKYYNLEFNCMGTSRVQYGQYKTERTFLAASLLKDIQHQTLLKSRSNENINWELTLSIPKKVFEFHSLFSFEQCSAKVNFYKCGDGLPKPHFLCWNNVEAPMPEFHLPDFFKEAKFLSATPN